MRKCAWLALPLSLAILLSACGAKEEAAPKKNKETAPTAPVQQEMSQEQLDAAIYDTELQLIAAALENASQRNALSAPVNAYEASLVDLDGDGKQELVGTLHALIFDPDNRGTIGATFTQGGIHYFTDKEGNLYKQDSIADFFSETVNGKPVEFSGGTIVYHSYTDAPTIRTTNCAGYLDNQEYLWQKVTIGDETYSWEEGQKKLAAMELTEITTHPGDFTTATYDAVYTNSLVAGLDSYLKDMYPGYQGMFTADIDGDGLDETGFLIPGLMDDWLEPYQDTLPGQDGMTNWLVNVKFNYETQFTGFLLVDPDGEQVSVRAGCSNGDLRRSGDSLAYEKHILTCGEARCYLPTPGQELEQYAQAVHMLLESYGYTNIYMVLSELSDMPGQELLCLGINPVNNDYEGFIFTMDDLPVSIYAFYPSNRNSFFISGYGDQPALLQYTQTFRNYDDYQTSYSYKLLRFDAEGKEVELDSHSVSYTKDQSDGTEAAAFFTKLNPYLQKLTVLYDSFLLTGKQWPEPEDTIQGTPPENPEPETQEEEATLGFVQVESEKSWLHLRTGPGTNYDKVLTNPADPNSFVRQALGSPVTILETIETDDPENPVWVKIRITYQDTEIVGYSSKTYIRTP